MSPDACGKVRRLHCLMVASVPLSVNPVMRMSRPHLELIPSAFETCWVLQHTPTIASGPAHGWNFERYFGGVPNTLEARQI